MGNYLTYKHEFLCLRCNKKFLRNISGSLLCEECRIYNVFSNLPERNITPEINKNKYDILMNNSIFPTYQFVKEKNCKMVIESDYDSNFSKEIIQRIKHYKSDSNLCSKYYLLKYILYFLEQERILSPTSHLRGMYIYSKFTNDVLFVYHRHIKDQERVMLLNLDALIVDLK